MVNRQVRSPGEIARVNPRALVGGGVDTVVGGAGAVAETLQNVTGKLAGTFMGLAEKAAAREGQMAGLQRAQQTAIGFLQQRQAEQSARKRLSSGSVDRDALHEAQKMQESGGNPNAVSPKGARGLMQIMPDTAAQPGFGLSPLANIDDPEANEAFGKQYMDKLIERYDGDYTRALAAYNWGAGNVDNWDGNLENLPAETRNYVTSILANSAKQEPGRTIAPRNELVLSSQPLQLRRDGTVYGDAYDRAAISAYGWRVEQGLANDLTNAHENFKDDPAGFNNEVQTIRQKYLQDGNLDDPQLREVFDEQFLKRTQVYQLDIATRQQSRVRLEQQSAANDALDARALEIGRQAYASGGNPQAGEVISEQVATAERMIDNAVRQGALTPEQASKKKEALRKDVAIGRVQGVYDNLQTPDAKEQFAIGLLEDWAAGKGELASLPYSVVKGQATVLANDARSQRNGRDAETRMEQQRIRQMVDSDLASLAATGKGVEGLSPEAVKAALPPTDYAKWQTGREKAGHIYAATAGMETASPQDISQRLELLAPVPGSPDFADQEDIFEAAQKKAAVILKARSTDPAKAASEAFSNVADLEAAADPSDPVSMQQLVAARLQAQSAMGIDDLVQEPLTQAEAQRYANILNQGADPRMQSRAMQGVMQEVANLYGEHGERVVTQILQRRGVDREMAQFGASYFGRLGRGERPSARDSRQGQVLSETAASMNSQKPVDRDAWPVPPYKAQQRLLSNPDLAEAFDAKYGPGASRRILGTTADGAVDGGKMTINPDGSEEWVPNDR